MGRFQHLLMAAGILLAASAARGADEYDIRLQRPMAAGQSYGLSATNTLRASEKIDLPDGSSTRSASFRRVILDADVHVDNVDDKGVEAQVSLTIRRLTIQETKQGQMTDQSTPDVVLDPGTQVLVLYAPGGVQPNFVLKKAGVLPDEAMLALQQGFKRMSINDALFGTREKKKVGDNWPLDKSALPKDRTSPQYIDPALVTGTVTFKALRAVAGVNCLQIDGTMTTKDFQVQGVVPKDATMSTIFTVSLPVDAAKQAMAWNVRSTTHFVTEDKPLGQGTVRHTVDSEIVHEASVTPK
jgi:hypothetical protein